MLQACLAVLASVLLPPVPPSSAAEEEEPTPCVKAAVAAIQKRYETVRDLSARFSQSSRSVAPSRGWMRRMASKFMAVSDPRTQTPRNQASLQPVSGHAPPVVSVWSHRSLRQALAQPEQT